MKDPKVTVVIPCFNHGQYLGEALQSVREQTVPALEVIIVDDGSTDAGTLRILDEIAAGGVKVMRRENGGPSAARNTGIGVARGEYILPLDADDRISGQFLERTTPLLDADPAIGIVHPQTLLFGDDEGPYALPAYDFPGILVGNMIVNTSLFRRADWARAGGYDEAMRRGWEDWDFWLSLLALGRRVAHAPGAVLHYRKRAGSRNHALSEDDMVACYARLFRNHARLYSENIEAVFRELVVLRAANWRLSSSARKSRWRRLRDVVFS